MITKEVDYVDHEITVIEQEPATLEELVQLYGAEQVRANAIDTWRYRNKYPRVYVKTSQEIELFCPRLVKETKTLTNGIEKKIFESEMDHIRRALQTDVEKVTSIVTRIAQNEPLFVEGTGSGGGRVTKETMDSANQFFAQGEEVVEEKVATIESMVPNYKVARDAEGNASPESLAKGIHALNRHLVKQANAAASAALGTTK